MAKKSTKSVNKAMGLDEYRPHLEITEKMYPKIKDLKVDEIVKMEVRVKINSISRSEWGDKKLRVSAVVLDAEPEKYEDD